LRGGYDLNRKRALDDKIGMGDRRAPLAKKLSAIHRLPKGDHIDEQYDVQNETQRAYSSRGKRAFTADANAFRLFAVSGAAIRLPEDAYGWLRQLSSAPQRC